MHVTLYDHARAQEPLPQGGDRIDNFGKPLLWSWWLYYKFVWSLLGSRVEDFLKKCIFTIWLICPRPGTRTCALGSWNLQYFVRPYLGNHNYKLCLVEEKTIFERNNAFSLWLSCPRPSTRNAALGIMQFTFFVDPYLVFTTIHHYYALRLSEPFLV